MSRPSTVVNRPPRVPGSTEREISGQDKAQVSDLRISRDRSSGLSTWRVVRRPFSGTSPPVLTSFVRSIRPLVEIPYEWNYEPATIISLIKEKLPDISFHCISTGSTIPATPTTEEPFK